MTQHLKSFISIRSSLIFAVLCLICLIGWHVWQSQKNTDSTTTPASNVYQPIESWAKLSDNKLKISFEYPKKCGQIHEYTQYHGSGMYSWGFNSSPSSIECNVSYFPEGSYTHLGDGGVTVRSDESYNTIRSDLMGKHLHMQEGINLYEDINGTIIGDCGGSGLELVVLAKFDKNEHRTITIREGLNILAALPAKQSNDTVYAAVRHVPECEHLSTDVLMRYFTPFVINDAKHIMNSVKSL